MNEQPLPDERHELSRRRWELLEHVNALTERPMNVLGFVWLALLVLDLTRGLPPLLALLSNVIWGLFVADFILELLIAPDRSTYLGRNWLTALALLLPALRVLRVFRVLRLLRAARAARSVNLLRVLTSLNRGLGAARHTLARRGVGYVVLTTALVLFGGAAGMLSFESRQALREAGLAVNADQGAGLDGYGEALWWTSMILTTMGTDYWPRTAEGRLLCLLLALYAFAVFGYITATIASRFVGRDREAAPQVSPGDPAQTLSLLREEVAALRRHLEAAGAGRGDGEGEMR